MRRTKILATIGPASESKDVLTKMVKAGLNAVRCNFSHGTADDHRKRVQLIREVAKEQGVHIGILADLQGPKIRVAKFKNKSVELKKGADFILDADMKNEEGDEKSVGIDYKALPQDVSKGDILLLDDGKVILKVDKVSGNKVHCKVSVGGKLSNNKGINKKGGGLTAPALTDKDKEDIKTAAALDVDYVAVSFPRDGKDLEYARKLLKESGSNAGIVSKVERTEAVDNIEEIIKASDAVMVARGDLAVEIGDENVPAVQKMIIRRARQMDKVVITATQMMESMITNSTPTRAEVSDVANAVLDGTDTVMLSAESAAGEYPVETVAVMNRVCEAAENNDLVDIVSKGNIINNDERIDEAVANAAVYLANHVKAKAIISLTESGSTALWMSRINTRLPIYALSRNKPTLGRMTLYRGVVPIEFDSTRMARFYVNREASLELEKRGVVKGGDWMILTSGDHMGVHGGTNKIKVIQAGNVV
ncbi:pyruvate kinase [Fangia hongkongensis]|uniref:pyruvate kinase n=1 Tax=Fangia hongkongensis TaxID=270495 RepID=UPI0003602957|nr:pyruvate kinase [Fangia hongkongensis]MBK2124267.1 pyruvate kinase [Fangia hongkongensis]